MKTVERVTVNFKMTPEEREYIKILAAKARLSQSEFLRRLIHNYGDELVHRERQPTFTPESGLPENEDIKLYWLTDGEELFDSQWMTPYEFKFEQSVSAKKYTGNNVWWIQSDTEPDLPRAYSFPGSDDKPIVHVFMNPHGELTLVGSDDEDNELPLASISDLQASPEWVEAAIHLDWHVRVREGVVKRYCEHDGTVVWAGETID
jgi:hypothetical protein